MHALVTNHTGLMAIAMDSVAASRNRRLSPSWIEENADPDGHHLCTMTFVHNDVEMRTMWIIAVKPGTEDAIKFTTGVYGVPDVMIDVGFDVFEAMVKTKDVDDSLRSRLESQDNADL